MINAGLTIKGFSGTQVFNTTTKAWDGVAVTINYPTDQDVVANPPLVGDHVIEPNGNVWEVKAKSFVSGNDFNLSLYLKSDTPSSSKSPDFGLVQRGSIVTPINNILAPFWDAVLVSSEIAQIAALHNVSEGVYGNDESFGAVLDVLESNDTTLDTLQELVDFAKQNKAALDGLDTSDVAGLSAILASNDGALNTMQEIVNFIKANKSDLDSLTIASIAGLQTALNGKLGATAKAADSNKLNGQLAAFYATKASVDTLAAKSPKITLGGDLTGVVTLSNLGNGVLTATVKDNSHNHTIGNVTGLQDALDAKLGTGAKAADSNKLNGQLASFYAKASDLSSKLGTTAKAADSNKLNGQLAAFYATKASVDAVAGKSPKITLAGDLTGSVTLSSLGSATLTAAVKDDSHNHTIANVDGLQTALNGKLPTTAKAADSNRLNGQLASFYAPATLLENKVDVDSEQVLAEIDPLFFNHASNRLELTTGAGTKKEFSLVEYGFFTPTIFGSDVAGTPTYTTQHGRYTRIGNIITYIVRISFDSTGGMDGDIFIRGLPIEMLDWQSWSIGYGDINNNNLTPGAYSSLRDIGSGQEYLLGIMTMSPFGRLSGEELRAFSSQDYTGYQLMLSATGRVR